MTESTIFICPRCQQRAIRSRYSGDFVHKCFGNEALRNEDILVIGDWEDYTGSDNNVSPSVIKAIQPNKLQGQRAGLEGEKEPGNRTSRGFPRSRFRTRQHFEHIDESFFKTQSAKSDREIENYD